VLRYLRVAAPDRAEDLTSETWLQVARDLRRFKGDWNGFRSWVFSVARHRAIDYKRAAARREIPSQPPDTHASPDAAVVFEENLSTQEALALIASLPPPQAEIVALRVVAGLDVATVARIVGKRPGTVRVLSHRGLRALAQKLGPPPWSPPEE
jgi:RNA polymerase sigma-70 factor (ECF subfamily)